MLTNLVAVRPCWPRAHTKTFVAPSSERTYHGYYGALVEFGSSISVSAFMESVLDEMAVVWLAVEYVTCACGTKGLRPPTIEGHTSVINCFHGIFKRK